ncbi:uncharacterized protein J7T54_000180 [Emericellopsis cladophorae]|uniref:Uncharacterized protein n=1 Tax=Emericellopsis cladophorae TaxID=2686198 RepID=A0A9P9XZX3_9HYPO|nr:uncharacterized protein J7T54_000180 [Emericellopsis cladophorae]KAI6780540.1 hypothetical protein J7T54_000180 [Emericellopsis cladophorae]
MTRPRASEGYAAAFTADHSQFLCLLPTTAASVFVFYCSVATVRFSGDFYQLIVDNRPSVQFAVQILANALSFLQALVLCRVINFTVRRYFAHEAMSLDSLRLWIDLIALRMNWGLPCKFWLPLGLFMLATMALKGIWAAALTPVEVWKATHGEVFVPSWENVTHVKEYPSEVGREGPTIQTSQGRFSYSVGTQIRGHLLMSATSATTTDGGSREHRKIDNSRYTYIGRSYGLGTSAGLLDRNLEEDRLAISYKYQEDGYTTDVKCIHNETSNFWIGSTAFDWLWAAQGELPDSDDGREYSDYIGHRGTNIVALGVAHFADVDAEKLPLRKYLAFSTGESYKMLDKLQCEVDFTPARFNVTVNKLGRNITVVPTEGKDVEDIEPSRRLKGTVLRQFALISNDETNLYVSVVGQALNASITDLYTYYASRGNDKKTPSDEEMVRKGVENSIKAVCDDMLGAYGSAQLVLSDLKSTTPAEVRKAAIAIGEIRFAAATFAINTAIILAFIIEAVRTSWWKGLPSFDIGDIRQLIVASSNGGPGLGRAASQRKGNKMGQLRVRLARSDEGLLGLLGDEQGECDESSPIMEKKSSSTTIDVVHYGRSGWGPGWI